jgi:hypothetical protein
LRKFFLVALVIAWSNLKFMILSKDWVWVQETARYTSSDGYRSRSRIGDLGARGQFRLECLHALEAYVLILGIDIRHTGNLQPQLKSEPWTRSNNERLNGGSSSSMVSKSASEFRLNTETLAQTVSK